MVGLSFAAFEGLDWPLGEIVVSPGKFVHEHFCLYPYELGETLPDGGDLVVLIGGRDRREMFARLAEHPGRVVVVFGPQDLTIGAEFEGPAGGLPENVVALYGTNVELSDQRALPLPLGLNRDKVGQLRSVRRRHRGPRDGLVYGSFAITNMRRDRKGIVGPPHRAILARRLQDVPWATLDAFAAWRDDPAQQADYYAQIARHRFTLSPEGFGPDCYRTWESLYLGSIPIVMRSAAMSSFAELPILFVDDYSEISQEYLEARWEEMSKRSYDLTKLTRSHYLWHFVRAVSSLRNPRFICWRSETWPGKRFVRALEESPYPLPELRAEPPDTPGCSPRSRVTNA